MDRPNLGGERIVFLRELMNCSQKDFSGRIGITQGALSQIESGKSQASFETIRRISEEYNVNCNWLVSGFGDVLLHESQNENNRIREKARIPLIKEEAHAGYIRGFHDKKFILELDSYQIPGFENGNYRLFEIAGDSMVPTIRPGDIVVCEYVQNLSVLGESELCVLISDEGILAKRVSSFSDKDDRLRLASDNPDYESLEMETMEIHEVWAIRARISTQFESPGASSNSKRLEQVEKDIQALKDKILYLSNKNRK